jgi:hypothetical protein
MIYNGPSPLWESESVSPFAENPMLLIIQSVPSFSRYTTIINEKELVSQLEGNSI